MMSQDKENENVSSIIVITALKDTTNYKND